LLLLTIKNGAIIVLLPMLKNGKLQKEDIEAIRFGSGTICGFSISTNSEGSYRVVPPPGS
jgi:hypothetical protein